jgi:uncharacterized delta-60 repeat protein
MLLGTMGLVSAQQASAHAGDLSPDLGFCGLSLLDVGNPGSARDSLVYPDGRQLVVGRYVDSGGHFHMALARFMRDGSLDDSFDGGAVTGDFGDGSQANAVAIQYPATTKNVIVAGQVGNSDGAILARFGDDGLVDNPFGSGNGSITKANGIYVDVAVDNPSGNIVALFVPNAGGGAIDRYSADGVLAGSTSVPFNVRSVTIDGSGNIVVAGTDNSGSGLPKVAVMRYTSAGVADSTFNGGSPVVTAVPGPGGSTNPIDFVNDVVMQGTAILVGGAVSYTPSGGGFASDFMLVRYTSAGVLDSAFDGDGIAVNDFGAYEYINRLGFDSSGNILASGSTIDDLMVARYSSTGSPDTGFGAAGAAVADFGGSEQGLGIGVDAAGTILLGMWENASSGTSDFQLMGAVAMQPVDYRPGGYVFEGFGGLHPTAVSGGRPAPCAYDAPYFGFNAARDVATLPGAQWGYELDAYGALHPFSVGQYVEPPATVSSGPYFPGYDIARAANLVNPGAAYVLDGRGALHPVTLGAGPAPAPETAGPYFPWDIARDFALVPGGGAYVLDGWGALHPVTIGGVTPPAVTDAPYFPGNDIAKRVVVLPDGSGGYILDGRGALHPFSITSRPPNETSGPYFNFDIARGVTLVPSGGAYITDGYGGVHPTSFAGGPVPAAAVGGPYFPGFDIAREFVLFAPPAFTITSGSTTAAKPAVTKVPVDFQTVPKVASVLRG